MNAKKLLISVLLLLTILSLVSAQSEYPALPAFFYGNAEVNGRAIPVDSKVVGKINGQNQGEILVDVAGEYGRDPGDYKLGVIGTQSLTGEIIEFYLKMPGFEEIKAEQISTFESGKIVELDLTFTGQEIAVEEPETPTSTTIGGGGAGGPSGSLPNEVSFFYALLEEGKQKDTSINNPNIFITKIQMILNKDITNVSINLENLVAPVELEDVYKYVSIEVPQISEEDITIAILKFKIPNTWLLNYDPESVVLMRYTSDGWTALETIHEGSDDYYNYYRAGTPGFSYFAAKAERLAEPTVIEETTEEPVEEPEEIEEVSSEEDQTEERIEATGMAVSEPKEKKDTLTIVLAILLIITLLYIYYDKMIKGG